MSGTEPILRNEPTAPPAPLTATEIDAWLDYAEVPIVDRRAEVIAALESNAKAYPTIEDDEALALVSENVKMAGALSKLAEDHRAKEKLPYLTGGRTVDAWFHRFAGPLATAIAPVQRAMDAYAAKVLAKKRADAQRIAEEARVAQEKAAEEARQAMERNRVDAESKMDKAIHTSAVAEKAEAKAAAPASAHTRVRGMYGATTSAQQSWRWEVEDESKIPREYLMVNEAAINAACKDRNPTTRKPLVVIPGIRFVEVVKARTR